MRQKCNYESWRSHWTGVFKNIDGAMRFSYSQFGLC